MSRAYKFKSPEGIYFITFSTVGWVDVFTRPIYNNVVLESLEYSQQNKGLAIFGWCIMSNHIHLIAKAKTGFDISAIIRDIKRHTSKQLIKCIQDNIQESRKEWMLGIFRRAGMYNSNNKEYQFWQQNNKPIELWSNEVLDQKLDYIHNNPVKSQMVDQPQHYRYSSARDYIGEKGLLKVDLIF